MKMRLYEGLQDLSAMFDLLTEGSRANNGTHYVHRGDLQWWLFYNDDIAQTWKSKIYLWEADGRLLGWALLSPDEHAFDVFTVPELRDDPREHEMLAWASEQMPDLDYVEMNWVADDDNVRIQWLEKNGFEVVDDHHTVHLKRSLADPLTAPQLPDGFSLRASRGDEADARLRAVASHAAFGSKMNFEEYWPRTWRLMQSPIYVKEHEIFVVAPNGAVAAYCIIWTDEQTKLGHFEPVGTHPDYQRRGLGKCLLFEGLRRLQSEGMTEADVCTNHDNVAAIPLYKSVGFHIDERLLIYKKKRTT